MDDKFKIDPYHNRLLEKRLPTLHTALLIEHHTTLILSELLGIKGGLNCKSFSGSGSISFSQKVNLLIDIKVLDAEERTKFQHFMTIRNQFLHRYDASTYKKCIDLAGNGLENWLLKTYGKYMEGATGDIEIEEKLYIAVTMLAYEVLKLVEGMMNKLKEKQQERIENAVNKKLVQTIEASVNDIRINVDKATKKLFSEKPELVEADMDGFGQLISGLLYGIINEKMGYDVFKVATSENS